MESKPRRSLVIIGTGWAGYTLAQSVDETLWSITVLSPEPTSAYTPLLASAATGLFDFSLAEEPIRRKSRPSVKYLQARVDNIDFATQTCSCTPAFSSMADQTFSVSYDAITIAPGCASQTFGTPGVGEHALFVRTVRDAMAVRQRFRDMLEMASMPTLTDAQRRDLLHIIVVGGGPTGIEISAELYDLIADDFSVLYPHLRDMITIAIHDVAPHILPAFESRLAEYAMESLRHRKIEVKCQSHITRVEADCLYTREDGKIAYGMLIWATGNKSVPLVKNLAVLKTEGGGGLSRILTDARLRVLDPQGEVIEAAYALGDAADIRGATLPTTAEVACQKAEYLIRVLNHGISSSSSSSTTTTTTTASFEYKQRPLVAYLGHHDGVVGGREDWSGHAAWIAWRSKNLLWTRSWRRKVMIVLNWLLNKVGGKEVARN
ncbi:MAG: hypothetical protein M1825_006111 [Sarcosagium campestre]|nr:MAG: hypothetical protein M1825_006111 [Sarcosagium campestre]